MYPYLVHVLDEFLFVPFLVNSNIIAEFSEKLFVNEFARTNYDAVSYAIFFAIKYHFRLKAIEVQEIIESKNCIVLLLAYYYYESNGEKQTCKKFKTYAGELIAKARGKQPYCIDFEQNWLLVYEILSADQLIDEWKGMKQAGVSFIDKTKLNI
jgi:hypothetical protein